MEKTRLDKILRHEEICHLLSAMGTSIGPDEMDLTRIRYGKIIIMTDADVDGSHIRTLLLTFFYRHMPELIDAGKLYIAQPPLYRVARRKQVNYYHSEEEIQEYLLSMGTDGSSVRRSNGNGGAANIEGDHFRELLDLTIDIQKQASILRKKGFDFQEYLSLQNPETGALPRARVTIDDEPVQYLYSEQELAEFLTETASSPNEEAEPEAPAAPDDGGAPASPSPSDTGAEEADSDAAAPGPGEGPGEGADESVDSDAAADSDESPDAGSEVEEELPKPNVFIFHNAAHLQRSLARLKELDFDVQDLYLESDAYAEDEKFVFVSDGEETALPNLSEVLTHVRNRGQKGALIQRYKGLGEMNPDQLWETTMDPAQRVLVRVKMEDAVKTNEMFTVLMGTKVEPRREFIEKHALDVQFLDV